MRFRWTVSPARDTRSANVILLMAAAWISSVPFARAQYEACTPVTARVVSLQGSVELRSASKGEWESVQRLDTPVCQGDRLRTGPNSRAALFIPPENLLRVDQNTTVSVHMQQDETVVEFFIDETLPYTCGGAGYAISRFPRKFKINTPFSYAAVEGTEFLVALSCGEATVSVFDGKVSVEQRIAQATRVVLESGQTTTVGPAQPPAVQVLVKPTDAVQWTIYYPPLTDPQFGSDPLDAACESLAQDQRAGCLLERAEALVRVGRINEAQADIRDLLSLQPNNGDAFALRAVISVARNEKAEALRFAQEATELAPNVYRPWLALSYAQQASFELEQALASAQRAATLAPNSGLVQARVAELLMSLGRIRAAGKAARQAVAVEPKQSRGYVILGFVQLAWIDIQSARQSFNHAIELDSTDPLARLGLGLAIIRDGNLVAGREQIAIAVALDPTNSLLRSYVGKAYYEENTRKRDQLAASQYSLAKDLDPKDPTPWFYDAILKQTQNRPVEAMEELQESIELNGNRAVYRSKLLLDQDLAARSANLAAIYTNLGFSQLALLTAYQSLDLDASDYSGHRFLSDYYATRPGFEVARDSELLQAQLLQPISIYPVQPRLGGNTLGFISSFAYPAFGFNEFARLFDANRPVRLAADGLLASANTYATNVAVSGVMDRLSYSVGNFRFDTDGFRPNNDRSENIWNAFAQFEFSPDTSGLVEVRNNRVQTGSTRWFFLDTVDFVNDEIFREDVTTETARIGLRQRINPATTVIGTYAYRTLDDSLVFADRTNLDFTERTNNAEIRTLYEGELLAATGGLGFLTLDQTVSPTFRGLPNSWSTNNWNAYAYATLRRLQPVTVNLGVSVDSFKSLDVERRQVNPKLGVTWQITPNALLRAAALRTLSRPLISSQTLEPTQIAGFNQFFDDIIGANSQLYGVGFDWRARPNLYLGLEGIRREVSGIHRVGIPREAHLDEDFFRIYAYSTLGRRAAVSVGYEQRWLTSDDDGFNPLQLANSVTQMLPVEVRAFGGPWFASAKATYVHQDGRFCDFSVPPPSPTAFCATADGSDSFWLVDLQLGFLLPGRHGLLAIGVLNALDSRFQFQDLDPNKSSVARERVFFARANLQF